MAKFGKSRRLGGSTEFSRVFNRFEIKKACRCFYVIAAKNDKDFPRLGMVIAKKNCKQAVTRNQIKRQIREIFRLAQDKLPPLDIIVVARKGIADMGTGRFSTTMHRFLLDLR